MIATVINAILIILGGTFGTVCGNKIPEKFTKGIITAMGLITMAIGIQNCAGITNTLMTVICLVVGTVIGSLIKLDDKINNSGDALKAKLAKTGLVKGKFSDGFVTCSVLFAVGTMTVLGSIRAGLNKDYSIILTKSVMDCASAVAFSAALGTGVIFSAIPVFVIQGFITLLAGVVQPILTTEVVAQMSAVGGPIFVGLAINLLGLRQESVKVGDMLPAIFLPIIFCPLAALLGLA